MRYTSSKKSDTEIQILCYGPYVIAIKGPHPEYPDLVERLLARLNASEALLLLDAPTLRAFVRLAVLAEAEVDRLLNEFGLGRRFKGMLKPQGYSSSEASSERFLMQGSGRP
ncbi:MAG: hypothetical protein ABWY06_06715 [Pseudomonas sp.]|uniref:hypothetical protein n=1 Tax=Pseudomonas sp. TaxID=306 RepID=UPI00339ADA7B